MGSHSIIESAQTKLGEATVSLEAGRLYATSFRAEGHLGLLTMYFTIPLLMDTFTIQLEDFHHSITTCETVIAGRPRI